MRLAPLIAALPLALGLAACDRGGDGRAENDEKPASAYTRNGPQAGPRPQVPAAEQASAAAEPRSSGTLASTSPQRDTLSDTVITGKIKAAILTDPGMTGADVSVNTDKGVVALAGSVKSQEQIAIASAHAQRQDGVLRIDNHLALNAQ